MFQHPAFTAQLAADRREALNAAARREGARVRLLATIVADPTQPGVARDRAFGRLLALLAAPDPGACRTSRPAA